MIEIQKHRRKKGLYASRRRAEERSGGVYKKN